MKLNHYKSLYDKMKTSKEMDERIMQNVITYEKKKKNKMVRYLGSIAAAIAVIILALQIQPIRAVATETIKQFKNKFTILSQKNGSQMIELEGGYVELSSNAQKTDCKMDSISEVSEMLGIRLLESSGAYEIKNSITYTPSISESGAVYGVMLINYGYAMGDLKKVNMETFEDWSTVSSISYEKGEKYHSPISMQITIRAKQEEETVLDNLELNYGGWDWKIEEGNRFSNTHIYTIPKLGIEAILYTTETDGMSSWQPVDGRITSMTTAIFMYEGIEYIYNGSVSQETMKEFLNTLE